MTADSVLDLPVRSHEKESCGEGHQEQSQGGSPREPGFL